MVNLSRVVTFAVAILWAESAFAQTAEAGHEKGGEAQGESASGVGTVPSTSVAEAKGAFDEGVRLLRAERWTEAEARFRSSIALIPRASARYDLAFVLYKEHRMRESSRILQELLDAPEGSFDPQYRDYAKALLPHVLAELAFLRLRVDPPSADVRVDGALVARSGAEWSVAVDPGTHWLEASAPGFATQRVELVAEAHAEVERSIALSPLVIVPARSGVASNGETIARRPTFSGAGSLVAVSVGGALLIGGAVSAILAKRADSNFSAVCPTSQRCDPQLQPLRDTAVQFNDASTVLLASGAAAVAGGVAWRLLARAPFPRVSGAAWAMWGTTAALATGATVAGMLTLTAQDDVSKRLQAFPGSSDGVDQAKSRARTLGILADSLAGAAVVSGGIALYLSARGDRGRNAPGVQVGLGATAIQIQGSY